LTLFSGGGGGGSAKSILNWHRRDLLGTLDACKEGNLPSLASAICQHIVFPISFGMLPKHRAALDVAYKYSIHKRHAAAVAQIQPPDLFSSSLPVGIITLFVCDFKRLCFAAAHSRVSCSHEEARPSKRQKSSTATVRFAHLLN